MDGSPPRQPGGGQADVEIIVIDKPFLTRPRLHSCENENSCDPLPLSRQVELLREALRPFAELGETFRSQHGDRPVFSIRFSHDRWRELTVEDFRRARSALAQTGG